MHIAVLISISIIVESKVTSAEHNAQLQDQMAHEDEMRAAVWARTQNKGQSEQGGEGESAGSNTKSEGVLNVKKIQVIAAFDAQDERRRNRTSDLITYANKAIEKAKRIAQGTSSSADQGGKVVADIEAKLKTAQDWLETGEYKVKADALKDEIKAVASVSALNEKKARITAHAKDMNTGPVKELVEVFFLACGFRVDVERGAEKR